MNKCPYCSQEIEEGLRQCPFCEKTLSSGKSTQWYYRGYTLFISFLFVGPLILPLVWKHPQFSKGKKVGITAVILVITVVLVIGTFKAVDNIKQYYHLIDDILGPSP